MGADRLKGRDYIFEQALPQNKQLPLTSIRLALHSKSFIFASFDIRSKCCLWGIQQTREDCSSLTTILHTDGDKWENTTAAKGQRVGEHTTTRKSKEPKIKKTTQSILFIDTPTLPSKNTTLPTPTYRINALLPHQNQIHIRFLLHHTL